jgi:CheY-like chemotaxis protein
MKLTLRVETVEENSPAQELVQVFDARGGSIGRARSNDMVLRDAKCIVSGRHAHVLLRDERYFLIDTSQNGTYLNNAGTPIGWCKSAELVHGDEVRIGPYNLAVVIGLSQYEAPTVEISVAVLAEMRKLRWGDDVDGGAAEPSASDPVTDILTEEIPGDVVAQMRNTRWGEALDVDEPDAQTVASGAQLFEETPAAAVQTLSEYSADVLVVDDDEEVCYFVKFMLERAGYTVVIAADGLSAIEYIDETPPTRMVVLDVVLPHLDGFQLIDAMRANRLWRGVPIIMLSELAGEHDIVRALNAGALDYVVKPFKPTELVARLQRFLPK